MLLPSTLYVIIILTVIFLQVLKMSEDFFHMTPEEVQAFSKEPNKEVTVDVVPRESIPQRFPIRPPGAEIVAFDGTNQDTLYPIGADGKKFYRMRFDVRGFEPADISVKMDGAKLAVSASHDDDIGLGNQI